MKVALDSNILVYMVGIARVHTDEPKIEAVQNLFQQLSGKVRLIAPTQTLGETYNVLQRVGLSRPEAREKVLELRANLTTVGSDDSTFVSALDLAVDHQLQFWDSLILNAAADAGCTVLLSEDMQSGFEWRGLRIVNPFATEVDRRLARILAG
jgi:predicted nucleic acid-binding protein